MFDTAGGVEMRLSFDHRVLDGATAAVALADMEGVLHEEITQECAQKARNSPSLVSVLTPAVVSRERGDSRK